MLNRTSKLKEQKALVTSDVTLLYTVHSGCRDYAERTVIKKMGLTLISAPLLGINYYTIEKGHLNVGHIVCTG